MPLTGISIVIPCLVFILFFGFIAIFDILYFRRRVPDAASRNDEQCAECVHITVAIVLNPDDTCAFYSDDRLASPCQ